MTVQIILNQLWESEDFRMDQIRIEQGKDGFSIILDHHGSSQEMDHRRDYSDAEQYALYLARRMKLDVYFMGKKIKA